MSKKEDIKKIVYYYFLNKDFSPNEKEFKILFSSFKKDAKKLYKLADNVDEVKQKIKEVKNWAERKELSWSLGTVVKKWFDNLKPKKEKKKPYFRGQRMYKKNDRWFVIPNDGGKHKEFAGDKEQIDWLRKDEVKK